MKPYKKAKKKKYKYKKPIEIGMVLLVGTLIIGIASLIVAVVWQNNQQSKGKTIEKVVQLDQAIDTKSKLIITSPIESKNTPEATAEETEIATGIIYTMREEFNYSLPQNALPVDNSYFDGALFIGDLVTAGIPTNLNGSFNISNVITSKNISLETALESRDYLSGNLKKVSLLELLRESEGTRKIYIMLGYNDLNLGEEKFIRHYDQLIDAIQLESVDSVVYVQSILPDFNPAINEKIHKYNLLIMEMCRAKGVNYLDVASVFCDNNGDILVNSAVASGHITGEFYYRWFDYLKYHTKV